MSFIDIVFKRIEADEAVKEWRFYHFMDFLRDFVRHRRPKKKKFHVDYPLNVSIKWKWCGQNTDSAIMRIMSGSW